MRWPPQPPVAQISHLQPQQPRGLLPASCWPPCPPQHIACSPFTEPQYPEIMPRPSSTQFILSVPVPGEQTLWFHTLVADLSRSIQDDERSAAIEAIDKNREEISPEDEKALIEALKRWKRGELMMPEVFEMLSKTNGHTETEWQTWFITKFEELNSNVDLTPRVQQRVSAGGTATTVSGGQGMFCDRPAARTQSQRSRVNEHTRSRKESASVLEYFRSRARGSTSRDRHHTSVSSALGPRADSHQRSRRVTKDTGMSTPSHRTRVLSRAGEHACPVTREDLRAMARYLFEKGDDDPATLRRYNYARWREFAARPENRKRTLDGWACIAPLSAKHAAAIEGYLKECRTEVEAAKP